MTDMDSIGMGRGCAKCRWVFASKEELDAHQALERLVAAARRLIANTNQGRWEKEVDDEFMEAADEWQRTLSVKP